MITSAKNYTKKKTEQNKKPDGPNPRTNGESKPIQTKSHPEEIGRASCRERV